LEILPEMEEKESQQQSESNISGSRENHLWAIKKRSMSMKKMDWKQP